MFGMDEFILVIDHEVEKIYVSEGVFADQYYDENRKTEKYDFYSRESLNQFGEEQRREYPGYQMVEVTSY